jgi:hypothetical protein
MWSRREFGSSVAVIACGCSVFDSLRGGLGAFD